MKVGKFANCELGDIMKKLSLWLITIACMSVFAGSCRGQLIRKTAPPKDGSHQTFTESFTGKDIQLWSSKTVVKKDCLVSVSQ